MANARKLHHPTETNEGATASGDVARRTPGGLSSGTGTTAEEGREQTPEPIEDEIDEIEGLDNLGKSQPAPEGGTATSTATGMNPGNTGEAPTG